MRAQKQVKNEQLKVTRSQARVLRQTEARWIAQVRKLPMMLRAVWHFLLFP